MISLDDFIKNIDKLQKQGCKILKKEILDLFEPVVFQYVISTRPDTGRARKEIGQAFARYVGSQRIIDATDADVEESRAMYNYWNLPSRADDFSANNCRVLMQNNLLMVSIVSDEAGLVNQEQNENGKGLPSQNHGGGDDAKTRPNNNIQRLPPEHLTRISDAITTTDNLSLINNEYIRDYISNDIKERVDKLINSIEKVLFNGKP
jgi:hypothetical protein